MSNPTNPRREQPNTYFVQDRSNQEELARLQVLDQMFTAGMGGVLSEQPDPTIFRRVLDVGCGTGGWLIEVAKTYPSISLLIGIDASSKMLDYARMQAASQQVADRVEFHQMDALQMLAFPVGYFDLVNHRSAVSWLRTWDWQKLLGEYQRVARPGGVIRITENDMPRHSSSPALMRLLDMSLQAFYQAGHFFIPERNGATVQLARLMQQHGIQNVCIRNHTIECRSSAAGGRLFYENTRLAFRTMVPFLRKWTHMPDDYEEIYQRMLSEIQQPDCVTTVDLLTAWGTNAR